VLVAANNRAFIVLWMATTEGVGTVEYSGD
jgi:hypothetical protein